jgi:hypothetical protein
MARKKIGRGGRREGAGRPPVLKDPTQRWVNFERRDLGRGERRARAEGISFAELVRKALRRYLQTKRERKR